MLKSKKVNGIEVKAMSARQYLEFEKLNEGLSNMESGVLMVSLCTGVDKDDLLDNYPVGDLMDLISATVELNGLGDNLEKK